MTSNLQPASIACAGVSPHGLFVLFGLSVETQRLYPKDEDNMMIMTNVANPAGIAIFLHVSLELALLTLGVGDSHSLFKGRYK